MSSKDIQTGPRGGKFYVSGSGKKVYLKSGSKRSTGYGRSRSRSPYAKKSAGGYRGRRVQSPIQSGPRGGKFHISPKSGRKVYEKTSQGMYSRKSGSSRSYGNMSSSRSMNSGLYGTRKSPYLQRHYGQKTYM